MTSYVLTLIGDAETNPLGQDHIDKVQDHLAVSGRQAWLAEEEACDVFTESPLSAGEITARARGALSGARIDVSCSVVDGRRKRLLISDMDSTIINQECIDELGDAVGVGDRIREITAEVVDGNIGFAQALRQRMALMKGLDRSLLEKIYDERISLMDGARTLVQTMRQNGAYCILVSGGFSFFTQRIAERVGFHKHQANELIFENDRLTGEVHEPVLGRTAKLETLNRLCHEHKLTPWDVLAVGDGANDIKMIEAAGMGVAFHGSDVLKTKANAHVDNGKLTALLYFQGYSKFQFVTS
ncbi:MAG: phosphoserine phosphatase SerB [Rhizobiaceae bacterium]